MKAKPKLKVKTETVHKIDSYDLEEFIRKVTGHEYEVVVNEEWSNDSQHRFDVDGKLDQWSAPEWEAFKATGEAKCYRLRTILNGLIHDGHMDAGIYLVTVCW